MKINIIFIEGDRLCKAQYPSRSSVVAPSLILDTELQGIRLASSLRPTEEELASQNVFHL